MDEAEAKVKAYAARRGEAFTRGDVSAATGLSLRDVEQALTRLMTTFVCRLEPTEKGELLYDFGNKLIRRSQVPLSERAATILAAAWRFFATTYKVIISIVLIAYFVAFVLLIVIALVAALAAAAKSDDSSSGSSSRASSGTGDVIATLLRLIASIFQFWTHHRTTYTTSDHAGYRYEHYEPKQTRWPQSKHRQSRTRSNADDKTRKKSLVASIYDFALGPPRVTLPDLHQRQELASFLRENKAVTCVSEIQALSGWSRSRAGQLFTAAVVDFEADTHISENGTLVGEFDQLITGTDDAPNTPYTYFWDEYEPEYELTGNTHGRNVLIFLANLFNACVAGAVVAGMFDNVLPPVAPIEIALGWFPLAFSASFFALPVLRSLWVWRMRKKQYRTNVRKRVMKAIFTDRRSTYALPELTNALNTSRTTEDEVTQSAVAALTKDFVFELGGQAQLTDNNELVYDFHLLDTELRDINAIRAARTVDRSPGDIVPVL